MNIVYFLQNILNGLSIGSVYAIFALGYTLVFSILGIINFAHGAVFTLGAYCTYALAVGDFGLNGLLAGTSLPFSLPFPLALLGGSVMAGCVGVLVERLAFRPLRAKGADPLLALVSSLGVALILVNCLQFLVGAEIYSFPSDIFGSLPMAMIFKMDGKILAVRTVQLIILGVSLAMLLVLAWFMNRTRMGKALQATAENPETASLLGINVDRYILSHIFHLRRPGRPGGHAHRGELRPGRTVFRCQLRSQGPGGHRAGRSRQHSRGGSRRTCHWSGRGVPCPRTIRP